MIAEAPPEIADQKVRVRKELRNHKLLLVFLPSKQGLRRI